MLELITHFSRFLKDGGIKRGETATASKLLAVNYKDESLWLSKVNVFVGSGVKSFLADIRLNPNSEELSQFYDSVYKYYLETSERMVEYFSKGLKSETVKYLTVLSPKAKDLPLEESRKKWGYLAEKFHNVVSSEEADLLHEELANYRLLPIKDHVHVNHVAVDQWYANLAKITIGDELAYPVLSHLALALCTMYNSSSEAERDFSTEKFILEDARKNSTSQLTQQSKMTVMSAVARKAKDCKLCLEAIKEKEEEKKKFPDTVVAKYRSRHCHCDMLDVDEAMLMDCDNGKPARRYKEALSEASDQAAVRSEVLAERGDADAKVAPVDLMKEVTKFRKAFQKAKEEKEKKRVDALRRLNVTVATKRKDSNTAGGPPQKKANTTAKTSGKTVPELFSSRRQELFKP